MGYRNLVIWVFLLVVSIAASVLFLVWGKYWIAAVCILAALFSVRMVITAYAGNLRKLNYLLGAFENGDLSFHFVENSSFLQDRVFNILLNKVRSFVWRQQKLKEDAEDFHNAVENLSRTGILGISAGGDVRCFNSTFSSMLGIHAPRHVSDLDKAVPGLSSRLMSMEDGTSVDVPMVSELRAYNVSIGRRKVMDGTMPVSIFVFDEIPGGNTDSGNQENLQWQKMARIISHEVLNTITPIVSLSDTLLGMTDDRNVKEGIEVIGQSARGLLGFVNGYRALSRVPVPQIHPFRFRAMLDYVLAPVIPEMETLGGSVDVVLEDEGMVLFADEQLMRQVFSNILKNALNALRDKAASQVSGNGFRPLITVEAFVNQHDNTEIHVSNNGDPIPEDNAERIFDPFFTTRADGTGVGLALSRQIMRAHMGTIRLDCSGPEKTSFVITL